MLRPAFYHGPGSPWPARLAGAMELASVLHAASYGAPRACSSRTARLLVYRDRSSGRVPHTPSAQRRVLQNLGASARSPPMLLERATLVLLFFVLAAAARAGWITPSLAFAATLGSVFVGLPAVGALLPPDVTGRRLWA